MFIIWIFAGPMVVVPLVAVLVLMVYSFYIQEPLRRSIEEGSRLASQKYANLVESILTDTESHANVADAFLTHEVCFAADLSGQIGKPVALPMA